MPVLTRAKKFLSKQLGSSKENYNPYVVYDGINWFICVGTKCADIEQKSVNDGIGIAAHIKDLAICSAGKTYKNVHKTSKIKKLKKKKRRLQRSISRKYIGNKKGECYKKTSNIIKSEKIIKTST